MLGSPFWMSLEKVTFLLTFICFWIILEQVCVSLMELSRAFKYEQGVISLLTHHKAGLQTENHMLNEWCYL
jgi:hypothetical protein